MDIVPNNYNQHQPYQPYQPIQSYQYNKYNQLNNINTYAQKFLLSSNTQQPLIDQIKNLNLMNVSVFSKDEIVSMFGKDINGLDICCVRDKDIVAIKKDDLITGKSLNNLTHFLYGCSVIEQKYGSIKKIFIGNHTLDEATITALNRNNVEYNINYENAILFTETTNYINTLYTQ